jgi:hypothetical protein
MWRTALGAVKSAMVSRFADPFCIQGGMLRGLFGGDRAYVGNVGIPKSE